MLTWHSDISNNDLSILTQFPDWNTRQAAIEIVLLRFAASKECREDLHRKLNDPGIDPDERETAQHLAQWAARSYNIDLSVRRRFDFRDNATTEASEHEAAGGEGEEGWEPSSPLFEPGFSLGGHVFDGGADDEEESEEEEESVDDSGRAEENRDNFHALPMNPDDMSDAEDVEAERRTRRRNAMVLGTDGDGLEIFEGGELRQSIEGLSPRTTDVERTAEGLLQQVRGLDNRVQGLLDTLRRMSSPDG